MISLADATDYVQFAAAGKGWTIPGRLQRAVSLISNWTSTASASVVTLAIARFVANTLISVPGTLVGLSSGKRSMFTDFGRAPPVADCSNSMTLRVDSSWTLSMRMSSISICEPDPTSFPETLTSDIISAPMQESPTVSPNWDDRCASMMTLAASNVTCGRSRYA